VRWRGSTRVWHVAGHLLAWLLWPSTGSGTAMQNTPHPRHHSLIILSLCLSSPPSGMASSASREDGHASGGCGVSPASHHNTPLHPAILPSTSVHIDHHHRIRPPGCVYWIETPIHLSPLCPSLCIHLLLAPTRPDKTILAFTRPRRIGCPTGSWDRACAHGSGSH
jgi:hypothetical protein